MKNIYSISKGFVISYKDVSEPYLFNELDAVPTKLKLLERGIQSAAFTVCNYNELLSYINNHGLIFARHIHPYLFDDEVFFNEKDRLDFQKMIEKCMPYLDKEFSYVVQCQIATKKELLYSKREVIMQISDFMKEEGYIIEPIKARYVISLTILNQHAFIGISAISDNIGKPIGGVLTGRKEDMICRSEWKLAEAFDTFDIHREAEKKALDLGAAPGGWTHFLLSKGCYVDAIDPANLDERIINHPNATHYKMTAAEFQRKYPNKKYDIIVNDMKMDSNESIDIICDFCKQLKKDGICILTLKLPKKQVTKRLQIANEVLGKCFSIVKMKQLYFNRSEVTVYMRD